MSGSLSDNWDISVWPNPYNNELQYYTDRAKNVKIQNGKMIITPRKENYEHRQYTSGRVTSKYSFRYGRVEVTAKSPKGNFQFKTLCFFADFSSNHIHGFIFCYFLKSN